jgi:hypothetical protein
MRVLSFLSVVIAFHCVPQQAFAGANAELLQYVAMQTYHGRLEGSRHFTAAQARAIRRVLTSQSLPAPPTLYVVEMQCSDCSDYSSELVDIIAKVPGWQIRKTLVIGYSEEPQSDIGLTLADAHPEDPSPATLALKKALKAARVPFSIVSATKPPEQGSGTKIIISRLKRF